MSYTFHESHGKNSSVPLGSSERIVPSSPRRRRARSPLEADDASSPCPTPLSPSRFVRPPYLRSSSATRAATVGCFPSHGPLRVPGVRACTACEGSGDSIDGGRAAEGGPASGETIGGEFLARVDDALSVPGERSTAELGETISLAPLRAASVTASGRVPKRGVSRRCRRRGVSRSGMLIEDLGFCCRCVRSRATSAAATGASKRRCRSMSSPSNEGPHNLKATSTLSPGSITPPLGFTLQRLGALVLHLKAWWSVVSLCKRIMTQYAGGAHSIEMSSSALSCERLITVGGGVAIPGYRGFVEAWAQVGHAGVGQPCLLGAGVGGPAACVWVLRAPLHHAGVMRLVARRLLSTSAAPCSHDVLHSSRIPTSHFQDSLPKLPVPDLKDTLKRMLYAMEPLSTTEELAEARRLADDFANGDGPALQAELVARDKAKYSKCGCCMARPSLPPPPPLSLVFTTQASPASR
jgi:hypothetical protein